MIDLRSHTPKGRRARDAILAAAESLLVTRGFHGTSVRDVAAAAHLPLATVVYHFARKEQLYAAVLETIASELGSLSGVSNMENRVGSAGSLTFARAIEQQLDTFAHAFIRWGIHRPGRVQLLLRELLDNPARVSRATRLPLAPFLERATELVAAAQRAGVLATQPPELAVLHLVGAVSYVIVARPTVDRIVGRSRSRELAATYETEARALARRVLAFKKSRP